MTKVSNSEELRAEVERFRAANAQLEQRVAMRDRVRGAGSAFLLVLGCGLAVLALVAVWLRVTLLDTDRYVDTVAPIAAQPAVQDAVAIKLESAIFTRIDFAALAREALPERADLIAPAIERGAQSFISDRIQQFTRSEDFQTLWVEANRRAHTRLVELLTEGRSKRLALDDETLYLDLSPAVARVKTGLQERGLTRIADAIPPTVDGQVPLVQSSAFADARSAVKLLKSVAIVLPLLAILAIAGSIYLARPRRRGVLRAAIGIVLSMLALIALLAVGRSLYLDAISTAVLPTDAASAVFDAIVAFLRDGVRVVVVVALVVALLAFVAGMPLRRFAESGWQRFEHSRARRWVARHQRTLMLVAGGLGMLVLLAWSPLTGWVVLLDLLIVGAVVGAIAAVSVGASEPGAAVADQLGADDEQQHGHGGVVGGHP